MFAALRENLYASPSIRISTMDRQAINRSKNEVCGAFLRGDTVSGMKCGRYLAAYATANLHISVLVVTPHVHCEEIHGH